MKKCIWLALCLALLCVPAIVTAQETISVYNWGDYIDMDVLDQFEEETGIKVIYETFETNEDMYAKIAMGGSSYDVIFPSDYMIERMIQENLLQKINWDNVPNAANIDPRFMHEDYDPEAAYSIPYTWGTMGILYNKEMVEEIPTSWETLMDDTYAMDMLMLNSPRDTLAIALVMCGHDLNSTDPQDLADARSLLIEQKPMVLAYVVDEVKDKMIAGEASVALVWSGDATFCMDESDELDYVVPKEGSNIFYDSMCIPANARNVSGAEKFIDFMCRADIAAKNFEYVGYAIPNTAAIELLGAEEYNASPVNNPPQEALDKCKVFRYLGEDTKLYDQIWTEIISEF
ncbi:MAG: spermidine/putrescine ABC transporter substrate-binding protein [Christensenellales bacterium]|nr:spermidine/putrescine ABC transporter substrate-binding protein [Christensenellales bacterium]